MVFSNQLLTLLFYFAAIGMGAPSIHTIYKSFSLYDKAFDNISINPLEPSEQYRLDLLLGSAKKYYNLSLIVSGISLLISSLENFTNFTFPYGEIDIPRNQAAMALYLLTIILLIITDRLFLMALPWMRLDNRRPPFDWIVLGLSFDKIITLGLWFAIPLIISSMSIGVIVGGTLYKGALSTALFLVGYILIYFPRTVYYLSHLIQEKLDHRGGRSTLSIHLLYCYRLIRQIMYVYYIVYVLTLFIPAWNTDIVNLPLFIPIRSRQTQAF